jgi:hypothetical protein
VAKLTDAAPSLFYIKSDSANGLGSLHEGVQRPNHFMKVCNAESLLILT